MKTKMLDCNYVNPSYIQYCDTLTFDWPVLCFIGYLVNGFLTSKQNGADYIQETLTSLSHVYKSFNLILMDLRYN